MAFEWVIRAHDVVNVWHTNRGHEVLAKTRVGYSDGAGGRKAIHQSVRKATAGAATFEGLGNEEGPNYKAEGIAAEVPGKQTVPRAEAWGSTLLVAAAPRIEPVSIGVDASHVLIGMSNRLQMLGGPNGDLWTVLFSLLDRREHETRFFKIRSHQADEVVRQILA